MRRTEMSLPPNVFARLPDDATRWRLVRLVRADAEEQIATLCRWHQIQPDDAISAVHLLVGHAHGEQEADQEHLRQLCELYGMPFDQLREFARAETAERGQRLYQEATQGRRRRRRPLAMDLDD